MIHLAVVSSDLDYSSDVYIGGSVWQEVRNAKHDPLEIPMNGLYTMQLSQDQVVTDHRPSDSVIRRTIRSIRGHFPETHCSNPFNWNYATH